MISRETFLENCFLIGTTSPLVVSRNKALLGSMDEAVETIPIWGLMPYLFIYLFICLINYLEPIFTLATN